MEREGAKVERKMLRLRRPQADARSPRSKGPSKRKQAMEGVSGKAWSSWKYARGRGQRASLFPEGRGRKRGVLRNGAGPRGH